MLGDRERQRDTERHREAERERNRCRLADWVFRSHKTELLGEVGSCGSAVAAPAHTPVTHRRREIERDTDSDRDRGTERQRETQTRREAEARRDRETQTHKEAMHSLLDEVHWHGLFCFATEQSVPVPLNIDRHRDTDTERHRERGTERHREARRGVPRHRETQTSTEKHRDSEAENAHRLAAQLPEQIPQGQVHCRQSVDRDALAAVPVP